MEKVPTSLGPPESSHLASKQGEVQKKLPTMLDNWLSNKDDEIQGFTDRYSMKCSYRSLKTLNGGLTTYGCSPMLQSADSTELITNKYKIVERWAEHFDGMLNQLSSGKATGLDAIPGEIFKPGGQCFLTKLTELLFQSFWECETYKQELKDAAIVNIYKKRGNKQSCDSYR